MLETDGGAVEPEQVDDVIVGVGETFVIKLPVTWENDLLLRTELLVECKGQGSMDHYFSPPYNCIHWPASGHAEFSWTGSPDSHGPTFQSVDLWQRISMS